MTSAQIRVVQQRDRGRRFFRRFEFHERVATCSPLIIHRQIHIAHLPPPLHHTRPRDTIHSYISSATTEIFQFLPLNFIWQIVHEDAVASASSSYSWGFVRTAVVGHKHVTLFLSLFSRCDLSPIQNCVVDGLDDIHRILRIGILCTHMKSRCYKVNTRYLQSHSPCYDPFRW